MTYLDDEAAASHARIRAQVTRGTDFLDRVVPEWRERVEPGELDLASECGCVWGQLAGSYIDVFAWLEPESLVTYRAANGSTHRFLSTMDDNPVQQWMADHGFVTTDEDDDFDALTMAWQEALGME